VEEGISIRAVYERFPIAIKGTFLLRGADGLPHQVRIDAARADGCAAEGSREVGIEPMVLEVAPTQDTFVPFEVSTLDLPAGWYRLACELTIDGTRTVVHPGAPFVSGWPRGSVRRGTATIGQKTGGVAWETLECANDSLRLAFAADDEPAVKLGIDGASHPVLETIYDVDAGRGSVVAYPAMRTQERLTIAARGETPIELPLP